MKKAWLCILLVACMIAALAACGATDTTTNTGTQQTVQRTTTTTTAAAPTEFRPGIDGDCSEHNPFYHIVPAKLLEYVGTDKATAFTTAYKDTENYNIVKFVAQHGISREVFCQVLGITAENENDLYDENVLCDFTKKEYVNAIYGNDKDLFNRVFAYHKP